MSARRHKKRPRFAFSEEAKAQLVPLSYLEAQRIRGPIYCALVKELYADGCKSSAYHMYNLSTKENGFFEAKSIRDRVCDNNELLMALFENMKVAEKGYQLDTSCGYKMTCKCFYQILILLEPHRVMFDWLLQDVFDIIAPLCEIIEQKFISGSEEIIARIYFRSANFLSLKDDGITNAIKYMEKTLKLSRNEAWISDLITDEEWGLYPTLHLVAGRKLASLLLRYGRMVSREDPVLAAELARKAIIVLSEVDLEKNKMQYFSASVLRANFLILSERFETAYKILKKVCQDMFTVLNIDNPAVTSELFMLEGICLLNLKDSELAISRLREALKISRNHGLKRIEGEVCLALGKAYMATHQTSTLSLGRMALARANTIFTELGDALNRKKTHYMLAKLKADEIFPHFMDLLKDSTESYCHFYSLRQWKNHCNPFWKTMGIQKMREETDYIHCLMDENPKYGNLTAWER